MKQKKKIKKLRQEIKELEVLCDDLTKVSNALLDFQDDVLKGMRKAIRKFKKPVDLKSPPAERWTNPNYYCSKGGDLDAPVINVNNNLF